MLAVIHTAAVYKAGESCVSRRCVLAWLAQWQVCFTMWFKLCQIPLHWRNKRQAVNAWCQRRL